MALATQWVFGAEEFTRPHTTLSDAGPEVSIARHREERQLFTRRGWCFVQRQGLS
jgi:hypothetical protein